MHDLSLSQVQCLYMSSVLTPKGGVRSCLVQASMRIQKQSYDLTLTVL